MDLTTLSDLQNSYNKIDVCDEIRKKHDLSVSTELADFGKLRISALTKAAEISPFVKEVTIGPKSPVKKLAVEENISGKIVDKNDASLLEDKISEDLRYTLILKEYESKVQKTSEDIFKTLVEKMIAKRAESMRTFWNKQSDECERKALELRARKLQILKHLQENDNLFVLDNAKLDEKKCQIINKNTIENMNRILEEQNKATSRFASVTDSHTKICICYNEVSNVLNSDPLAKNIFDKYETSIETVIENINTIMDLCKTGTITDKEVKEAETLAINFENIYEKIVVELNELKQQEELQIQKEELAKKELEAKKNTEAKATVQTVNTIVKQPINTAPIFFSSKNFCYYEDLKNYLNVFENSYKELLDNTSLKKFRFDCQKAVNTPVNVLSSVSGTHIKDKFDRLSKLLRGESVQVLDTFVQASQHPQGLYYCTALLAKKIVRQGDLLVSSNPEAAFPLAAVAATLWSQFPEFGKLLEANFHRYCPYIVPMLLPQMEGQSDKEFYLSRGYTYNDEGNVEKQDMFLKRMSGIFRLYCAILITRTPKFVNASNPHGLCYGWKWLASFINLKPEPDICATLLHDFFSVCGSDFYKYYKKQFIKIIKLISTDYLKILENIDEGGPKTRLEVYLQNVLKTGHIPPPSGVLSQDTW